MFGMGSLMRFGGEDEDDFFGAHMQGMNQMNQMMNSMFSNPFGMMGGMGGFGGSPFMPPMMPQMPNMNQLMSQMQNNGNCHSYSSSTVMSMSNGPDGRPQVYQASSSTRSAPGGIRETKKAVCDSRTGVKKLAIGHAIGDKAHIIEREQNLRSGEQEERQDFINLDEEEGDAFNQEWQQKARQAQLLQHSVDYPQGRNSGQHSIDYPQGRNSGRAQEPLLALPDCNGSSSSSRQSGDSNSPSHRPQLSARHHHPLSGQHGQSGYTSPAGQRQQSAAVQSNQSGYPSPTGQRHQMSMQQNQTGYLNSAAQRHQSANQQNVSAYPTSAGQQPNQSGYTNTVSQASRPRPTQSGSVQTSPLSGSRKRDHCGVDKSPARSSAGDVTRQEVNITTPAPEQVNSGGYSGEKKLKTRE